MKHTCPHCGAPLPGDASFCPHCAQSVRDRRPVKIPSHLRRKGLKWTLVLVVLAAACAVLLWPSRTTVVILEEDENGMVTVTPDLLREYFPLLAGINEWGMFSARSSGTRICLLLFDRNTHLMGYFIGEPIQIAERKWQIEVVSCDYDFTELYEEQLAAFEESWREDFSTYIPPEEIENAGTVWFLSGYNTGKGPVLREDDAQIYHLWHALHASNLARQCREIQRLEEFLPSEGRWRCYLLLDADYDLLGYTMLDHQGNGG